MSNRNGLVGGIPVFKNGSEACWLASDSATNVAPSFTASTGAGFIIQPATGVSASITADANGEITIAGDVDDATVMNLYPAGASNAGVAVSAPGQTAAVSLIAPTLPASSQLVIQASPYYDRLTIAGGSAIAFGPQRSGAVTQILTTGTGNAVCQFAGSNCVAGTVWDFIIDPASSTAVQFVNTPSGGPSQIIYTVPATPDPPTYSWYSVRIFTPDGVNFVRLVPAPVS